MNKNETTLPEIWIVTGCCEWSEDKKILAVCPDKDNALRACAYYDSVDDYSDVECTNYPQVTFSDAPYIYQGSFMADLRPYGENPETYIFGKINFELRKKYLKDNEKVESFNDFKFHITKRITDQNRTFVSVCGSFINPTELPFFFGRESSDEKNRRKWLIDKINTKNIIQIVLPDFEN
jgi:hypothetical protein